MDVHGFCYSPISEVGLKLEGIGATMTGGTYDYPSSILSPAYLNLHGTSDFWPAFINADSSILTCYDDQSYLSLTESNTNSILNLLGPSSITNSIAVDSASSATQFIQIVGNPNWQHSPDTTYITNTLIHQGAIAIALTKLPSIMGH